MLLVEIGNAERRIVEGVAAKLAERWGEYEKIRAGLLAEYAAIRCLNQLGATPELRFNEQYNENGGDGGFDFSFPDEAMRWDVKSCSYQQGGFYGEFLRKTKASAIVGVLRTKEPLRYRVLGFIPVSQLQRVTFIPADSGYFKCLMELKKAFPQSFGDPRSIPIQTGLESARSILAGISKVVD
jgi:hypothetical protein